MRSPLLQDFEIQEDDYVEKPVVSECPYPEPEAPDHYEYAFPMY
jgi:hypothetical protein